MSKLGLVLGAGGARGIAHLGVLKALEENNIKVDVITGCSMGAVIGGLYALGYTVEELQQLIPTIKKKSIIDISLNPISNKALLKGEKIDKLLKGLFQDKLIEDCKIPFGCVSSDIIKGEEVFFDKGSLFTAVRASVSIPTIIKPLEYDGKLLIDGGIINRVPVLHAKEMGADKIIAIDALGEPTKDAKVKNLIDLALRCIDFVDYYITNDKLNKVSPDILLEPQLGNMSQYKVEKLDFAYEQGYKITMENMDKIKALVKDE